MMKVGRGTFASSRIFAGHQCRLTMKGYPFVISNPGFRLEKDDRDRDTFYEKEALRCTLGVVEQLSGEEAFAVFEHLTKFWASAGSGNPFPMRKVIEALVRILAKDEDLRRRFRASYIDKLAAAYFMGYSENEKRLAKTWFSVWPGREGFRTVRGCFHELGIRTIPELCRENDGFAVVRKPDARELSCIHFLQEIVREDFGDLVSCTVLPECRVIANEKAGVEGYASTHLTRTGKPGGSGLRVKREISGINLKVSCFQRN